MQELLSTSRVNSLRHIREEEMINLVKGIAPKIGSTINLTKQIYPLTYGIVSRAAFGKRNKDQDEFISIVVELTKVAAGFNLADLFPSFGFLDPMITGMRSKLERLHQKADKIIESIIKEHIEENTLESKTEDLVDVLLKYHNNDDDLEFSLTTDNLKAVIWDIFSAGGDTSSTTIDWAMTEMVKNPKVMKKAQDEVREVFDRAKLVDETGISKMEYLKSVVKETLRLHPPVPLLLPRECGKKCEINGYEIPTKTRVLINAWSIARDPRYWTKPESFIPERFIESSVDFKGANFEYIPFGAGRRMCPGISFALSDIELPLAFLLYHFDWKLPSGMKHEELDMTELFGLSIRRKEDLQLVPIAYYPSPIEKSVTK